MLSALMGSQKLLTVEVLQRVVSIHTELYRCSTRAAARDRRLSCGTLVRGDKPPRPHVTLQNNRLAMASMTIAMCGDMLRLPLRPQTRLFAAHMVQICHRCESTLAGMALVSSLAVVSDYVWGDVLVPSGGTAVEYQRTGIEKWMGPYELLVPRRAVVPKGKTIQAKDVVSTMQFCTVEIESVPVSLSYCITLAPQDDSRSLLSCTSWRMPRRVADAVSTSVLCEIFESPVVTDESSAREMWDRAESIAKMVRDQCRLHVPIARGTGEGTLKLHTARDKDVAPKQIKMMALANTLVCQAFDVAHEGEEILVGCESSPTHAAFRMQYYAQMAVGAPLAERAAAVLATTILLGTSMQIPSPLSDISTTGPGLTVECSLEHSDPELLARWSSELPVVPRNVPRVPSPVDRLRDLETYGLDNHMRHSFHVRRTRRKRRGKGKPTRVTRRSWSAVVETEISRLD